MMNGVYEAVSVLALFPLIVAMGAGSNVTGKRSVALCKFLGELSYPLYITHFPLIYMQIAWHGITPTHRQECTCSLPYPSLYSPLPLHTLASNCMTNRYASG